MGVAMRSSCLAVLEADGARGSCTDEGSVERLRFSRGVLRRVTYASGVGPGISPGEEDVEPSRLRLLSVTRPHIAAGTRRGWNGAMLIEIQCGDQSVG